MINDEYSYDNITIEFYKAYYCLFTNDDEKTFIIKLIKIMDNFGIIRFKTITNAKKLILLMKNRYPFLYKICLFAYIKSDLVNKLLNFSDTKNIEFLHKYITIDIFEFNNMLNNEMYYLNAFNKFPNIKNNIIENYDIFDESMVLEIISRFKLLTTHFGEKMLLNMKLEKITASEIYKMDYNKIIKYYNDVINKIKKYMMRYSNICNAYINIECEYLKCVKAFFVCNDDKNFRIQINGYVIFITCD